jgi:hypothetical protein
MNFLQLVQRLHTETGRQGTAPSTTTGQTGMNARLVNWINTAYEEIQSLHESWLFRIGEFSFSTIASTQNYTAAGVSLTDFSQWKYDPDHNNLSGIRLYSAEADEQDLVFVPWEDFRTNYKYGSSRSIESRPTIFSIKPNMSMDLWAIPDAVYTVNGEYIKDTDVLSGNTDSPLFLDYNMIIVWKALMYYGAYEGAPEVYAFGENQYGKLLNSLERTQLPQLLYGASLA